MNTILPTPHLSPITNKVYPPLRPPRIPTYAITARETHAHMKDVDNESISGEMNDGNVTTYNN